MLTEGNLNSKKGVQEKGLYREEYGKPNPYKVTLTFRKMTQQLHIFQSGYSYLKSIFLEPQDDRHESRLEHTEVSQVHLE